MKTNSNGNGGDNAAVIVGNGGDNAAVIVGNGGDNAALIAGNDDDAVLSGCDIQELSVIH